ncbi:hypothetical protein PSJ60_23690 [Escherichia coli]|uniref:hypothetical protein n=1 Tax=Escherichia coli TaxID=562 RepID=UPI00235A19CA|nr:hypothetical protein [Escherichia coli]MDC9067829.1 hypothetical protein [Escherichia coli]
MPIAASWIHEIKFLTPFLTLHFTVKYACFFWGTLQSRITESRRFTVDGYTVTFAAGVKRGEAVVVFGIMTGLETVPVLTLEKKWSNPGEAESYVRRVTVIAAEKLGPLSGKLSRHDRED